MRKIIINEALYLALPPLFKIYNKDLSEYAYDEKEKNKIINSKFKNHKNISITRFKGLGEMPSTLLRETTMDSDKRKLIKITLKNGLKETKKIDKFFERLMGKKPEFRFNFIQKNANFTKNLDY